VRTNSPTVGLVMSLRQAPVRERPSAICPQFKVSGLVGE